LKSSGVASSAVVVRESNLSMALARVTEGKTARYLLIEVNRMTIKKKNLTG
jgi:hypothetical protein